LQAEHHPDADLRIGRHHRVEVAILERIERQHVLDRGHAGAQALERASRVRACTSLTERGGYCGGSA